MAKKETIPFISIILTHRRFKDIPSRCVSPVRQPQPSQAKPSHPTRTTNHHSQKNTDHKRLTRREHDTTRHTTQATRRRRNPPHTHTLSLDTQNQAIPTPTAPLSSSILLTISLSLGLLGFASIPKMALILVLSGLPIPPCP